MYAWLTSHYNECIQNIWKNSLKLSLGLNRFGFFFIHLAPSKNHNSYFWTGASAHIHGYGMIGAERWVSIGTMARKEHSYIEHSKKANEKKRWRSVETRWKNMGSGGVIKIPFSHSLRKIQIWSLYDVRRRFSLASELHSKRWDEMKWNKKNSLLSSLKVAVV